MTSSNAFDWACQRLESDTNLDRLEARGTIRLALKQAGFDANEIGPSEMAALLRKLMPGELASRGIEAAEILCERMAADIQNVEIEASRSNTPESVFARLGA